MAVFTATSNSRTGQGALGGLVLRSLIPQMRTPPPRAHHLSESPCPNSIALGVRTSAYAVGEEDIKLL